MLKSQVLKKFSFTVRTVFHVNRMFGFHQEISMHPTFALTVWGKKKWVFFPSVMKTYMHFEMEWVTETLRET